MARRLASIPDADLVELASGIETRYRDACAASEYHAMMATRRATYWRLERRTAGQTWARWRKEIIRRGLWPTYYRRTHYGNRSSDDRPTGT